MINVRARQTDSIKVGDQVTLVRPALDDQALSPGFGHILERYVGQSLTVRDVARGDGYDLVLVWETALPLRGSWLRK